MKKRPPRHWVASSLAILAAVLVTIAVLWRLGAARHGDPAVYFDEWEGGTYASGALLLACAVASGLLVRRLPGPARRL